MKLSACLRQLDHWEFDFRELELRDELAALLTQPVPQPNQPNQAGQDTDGDQQTAHYRGRRALSGALTGEVRRTRAGAVTGTLARARCT